MTQLLQVSICYPFEVFDFNSVIFIVHFFKGDSKMNQIPHLREPNNYNLEQHFNFNEAIH